MKTIRAKKSSTPWLSSTVLKTIKKRNKLYRKWKRHPSSANWESFKIARNEATTSTRRAKINFFSSKLDTRLPPKQLWKNIRQLSIGNKDENITKFEPDDLNDFFTSVSNSSAVAGLNNFDFSKYSNNHFSFCPVSPNDVVRCINKITSNATGEDGLPLRFIKLALPYILNA